MLLCGIQWTFMNSKAYMKFLGHSLEKTGIQETFMDSKTYVKPLGPSLGKDRKHFHAQSLFLCEEGYRL